MMGSYNHTIDDKGRLSIPPKLLKQLGDVFYVTVTTEQCLAVYSEARWAQILERLSEVPLSKQKMLRPLFANAAVYDDAKGRILLPQHLRTIAKLQKEVTVVGAGTRVEIWDTATWAKQNAIEIETESLEAAMEEIGL
ncbi:MAG: division/cell wall cluster transcriptional repressor MraZ [Oscillospiraceae bacterium]|nr:division/cell wall cluster transcriptional repressor MraZ [Oscillospiraceae bacterium]